MSFSSCLGEVPQQLRFTVGGKMSMQEKAQAILRQWIALMLIQAAQEKKLLN